MGILESDARWLFQQLLIAVDYCHRLGIANRDIKVALRPAWYTRSSTNAAAADWTRVLFVTLRDTSTVTQIPCPLAMLEHQCFGCVQLDNVLLDGSLPLPIIKMCDFGYSKDEDSGSVCKTACGTPEYMAPEVDPFACRCRTLAACPSWVHPSSNVLIVPEGPTDLCCARCSWNGCAADQQHALGAGKDITPCPPGLEPDGWE